MHRSLGNSGGLPLGALAPFAKFLAATLTEYGDTAQAKQIRLDPLNHDAQPSSLFVDGSLRTRVCGVRLILTQSDTYEGHYGQGPDSFGGADHSHAAPPPRMQKHNHPP